ncbi:MAG: MoxR family ATPase [Candidatus Eremiobacteraeota bacterium]|nr:MoxR family ATPase [Candidatus Eremiobacteraeota bacterium]
MNIEERVREFGKKFSVIREEIQKTIVGNTEVIDHVLLSLIADGHVLLEGVPGLGKTLLVKTIGQVLNLSFSRVQFTPDLMPADITGTYLVMEKPDGKKGFEFQRGPLFANLVLADEINRATPKTQSALLEAMQEHNVTVSGTLHPLPSPFFVLATQNPIEMEGTYPLPEAQVDRFFFKIVVQFPDHAELVSIIDRTTAEVRPALSKVADGESILEMRTLSREILIATPVKNYVATLILATHPEREQAISMVKRFLRYGVSPRGAQTLTLAGKVRALMHGRFNVSFEDIQACAVPALRHRLILNFEGEAEGISSDTIVQQLLKEVAYEQEAAPLR